MVDALRKKLNARAKNWNTKKRPPSELKSERLRKKLSRGKPLAPPRLTDCNGCQDYPCGKTTNTCSVEVKIDRCCLCGVKVMYRYVAGEKYYCPICKERRK